jgi:NAD-dependent DNA ligase
MEQTLEEQIRQLRICLAFHSYIYYELANNIIADTEWDRWALELKALQDRYGDQWDPKYDKWFKDWDATTGFHLCTIPGLKGSAMKVYPQLFKKENKLS